MCSQTIVNFWAHHINMFVVQHQMFIFLMYRNLWPTLYVYLTVKVQKCCNIPLKQRYKIIILHHGFVHLHEIKKIHSPLHFSFPLLQTKVLTAPLKLRLNQRVSKAAVALTLSGTNRGIVLWFCHLWTVWCQRVGQPLMGLRDWNRSTLFRFINCG